MIPNRVVLDTNVCLDLFVFRDPRWAALHAALLEGKLVAVTRQDCRMEWILVLDYVHFGLGAERQSACIAEFDALIICLPSAQDSACPSLASRTVGNDSSPDHVETVRCLSPASEPGFFAGRAMTPLPRCRDVDDQKFLETARDSGASLLITKDKALLRLAARCRRAGLFDIQKPETCTSGLCRSSGLLNS